MISPNTPSGTEIVCIRSPMTTIDVSIPQKGQIYTVRCIEPARRMSDGGKEFACKLKEISGVLIDGREVAYPLHIFRYLDLAGLDSLLNVKEKEPV